MFKTAQRYRQILRRQKHVWRFLVSRLLWRSGLCSLFEIYIKNYRLKFHPTALSANLWLDPQSRLKDEAFLNRYLRAGDFVVDVGANIGQLALAAASVVGPAGQVYCIEPHPRTFRFLRSNIALNKFTNVEALNLALGSSESEVVFADLRDDDQNRISESGQGILVKMTRLDDVDLPGRPIQLLKIDVEGYEMLVLQGATQTLQRVACIYFESYDRHFGRYGYTCRDLTALLEGKGFAVLKPQDDQIVTTVGTEYVSTRCENLIAVRELEEFLARTQFQLISSNVCSQSTSPPTGWRVQ